MNRQGSGSNPIDEVTRIFLVEDSAIIRERLVRLLEGLDGVEVVGYAETAADAIAGIVVVAPNVVVLDIRLKNGSGIDVLRHIKDCLPQITLIMLTNYATEEYRRRCLEAGAQYFLDKTNEFQNLQGILDQLRHNDQRGENRPC